MKPGIRPSFFITLLFFMLLSMKIIFEGINGLTLPISRIALQYALTISAGILCDFFLTISRRILSKTKIKNKEHSYEWARWLEYTIGMSVPGFVLVVLYLLQSLVWSFALFKTSMFILCLTAALSCGTVAYLVVRILNKFKRKEIIKFCIFTFGNAFMALLIYIVVYLFSLSPKLPFRDFFMQRAGLVSVVTMYIMGIPLYFISKRIKSFH